MFSPDWFEASNMKLPSWCWNIASTPNSNTITASASDIPALTPIVPFIHYFDKHSGKPSLLLDMGDFLTAVIIPKV